MRIYKFVYTDGSEAHYYFKDKEEARMFALMEGDHLLYWQEV